MALLLWRAKCFCFSDSPASHLIEIITNGKEHRVRKSFSCFPCIIVVSSPNSIARARFYCAICNNRCSLARRTRRQNENFIISLAGLGSEALTPTPRDIQVHRSWGRRKFFCTFSGIYDEKSFVVVVCLCGEKYFLLSAAFGS